jgi:hypothetical protein
MGESLGIDGKVWEGMEMGVCGKGMGDDWKGPWVG